MKLYDYTTGALVDVTEDELTDDLAIARLIPQVPSAFALYCALRAEREANRRELRFDPANFRDQLMTIRLVALTALPGEVRK